jgi:4-diphosphocytidyl-2-C-methyl-D-erythritol kinase
MTRHARVRALAKINLDLRVLSKREDGFHELRTIFQTISLADTIELSFTPSRRTEISLDDELGIADNLVARAARLAMEAMRATGRIEMRLKKRIPMGAGLGGGSSDAAAVLLALPALAGKSLDLPQLCSIAAQLGSDVPFFLLGGAAVGIGRGTELFPLPDGPACRGVVVAPDIHVNTAQAYRDLSSRLGPNLTTELQQNKMVSFQSVAWDRSSVTSGRNDFEAVVFEQHAKLKVLKKRLASAGANPAMMTGSGSALFGLFADNEGIARAIETLGVERTFRISLVGRARYRTMWHQALKDHTRPGIWPPRSRYLQ